MTKPYPPELPITPQGSPGQRSAPATPPPMAGRAPAIRVETAAPQSLLSPLPPPVTVSRPPPSAAATAAKVLPIVAGVVLVFALAFGVLMLLPRTGRMRIEIAGAGGERIEGAEIFVDGKKQCDTAPCIVKHAPGPALIKVMASEFETASVTTSVRTGTEGAILVTLAPAAAAAAHSELRVTSAERDIALLVDGKPYGRLPLVLTDLKPGTHTLRFDGGHRFESADRTIEIGGGAPVEVAAPALKVREGRVTISLSTPGARVALVRKDEGGVEKRLNGPWPMTIDGLEPDRFEVVAMAPGYEKFVQEVTFSNGNPELPINVELAPVTAGSSAIAAKGSESPRAPAARPTAESASNASEPGILNANSVPPSNVSVDGHALGESPVVGLTLAPGKHTVVFVHETFGKKSVVVDVKPGETAVAAVRLRPQE